MANAEQQVKAVIADKVMDVVRDPTVPLNRDAAKPVADALNQALGPIILNATNNEPWYTSKIIWGLIIAGVGTVAKPFVGEFLPAEKAAEYAESFAMLGQFAGIALAAYGRLGTKKPIA